MTYAKYLLFDGYIVLFDSIVLNFKIIKKAKARKDWSINIQTNVKELFLNKLRVT